MSLDKVCRNFMDNRCNRENCKFIHDKSLCKEFYKFGKCKWEPNCKKNHIIEKKQGGSDEHTNLTYICPNCHRLVHSQKFETKSLVPLSDYVGDDWKKYYYVKDGKIKNKT